jgi:hypothetical protein
MPITGALAAARNGVADAAIVKARLQFASRLRIKFPPGTLQSLYCGILAGKRKYDSMYLYAPKANTLGEHGAVKAAFYATWLMLI